MATTVLNQSLGLIVYKEFNGSSNAICFVGDLDRDIDEQAASYLQHEDIQPSEIVFSMWHNALEDEYGNRYEPAIKQVG